MKIDRKIEGLTKLHRKLLKGIALEIQATEHRSRAQAHIKLRSLFQAKIALLQDILEEVKTIRPENLRGQLQTLEKDSLLTYKLCRNPCLKIVLRLKARTIHNLRIGAKAAG